MKRKYLILFFIELLMFNSLNAQWEPCNGPYGGVINSILGIEDTIFVGSSVGMFKSTNKGQNWNAVGSLYNFSVICIEKQGNVIFAVTYNILFISVDNWNNWTLISNSLPQASRKAVVVKDTFVFLATSKGIFKSSDFGKSWVESNSGLTNLDVRSLG